jgi:FKBP-type peptidyl-prolyl cis-trans isomerase FkpA
MKSLLSFSALALLVSLAFVACQEGTGGAGNALMTPGGYKYVMHVDEEGELPQVGEMIFFHVTMSNGDSITYSSYQQPTQPRIQLPAETAAQPKSPVVETLELMSAGDSASLYFPIDSMQGRQRPPGYENATDVIYTLKVTRIISKEEFDAEQQEQLNAAQAEADAVATEVEAIVEKYAAGQLDDQILTTESGLKYLILEEGKGPKPEAGEVVFANYYGVLTDGTMFDNSYQRGQAFNFPLGQRRVIGGWDEGFALLNQGTTAVLFVPPALGYGAQGSPPKIPANSELIFYVELLDIR